MLSSLDNFRFRATIGKGNNAKVVLVEQKASTKLYAIKFLRKDYLAENDEAYRPIAEKDALVKAREGQFPFIVRLESTFQTESRLCFVLEYIKGGDLMFHLQERAFEEAEAKYAKVQRLTVLGGDKILIRCRFYAAEILLGLQFLHSNCILYRNLQLDNVLLTERGHIKLAGFFYAKHGMSCTERTNTFCGSAEFMAPEVRLRRIPRPLFAPCWCSDT